MPPRKKEAEKEDEPVTEPITVEAQPLSAHLDDLVARPYTVHLTPLVFPGRRAVPLSVDGRTVVFRRGEGGDLEHVVTMKPPQARQLRAEKWTVLERS